MVIYLDTSALLKLYVEEDGRELVAEAVHIARIVTAAVTYSEARAALARRMRERDFSDQEYRAVVAASDVDWVTFDRLQVSHHVAYIAGQLAERYALRGYDPIHLASALRLAEMFEDLQFLAFDMRLINAAHEAGLTVFSG